jgi:hypothetical protein
MERKEIKKALARHSRPRCRKMMKEPMAEPLARAPFERPRCNKSSIIEFKKSVPGAFIVDVKAHDGRMVKEDVRVPFGKKVTVFDEVEKKSIVLWTKYKVVPSMQWLRKEIGKLEYPAYELSDEKNLERIAEMVLGGNLDEKFNSLQTLQYAMAHGIDIGNCSGMVANALFNESDIIRISASSLLHGMAFRQLDISGAEDALLKSLNDENRLVVYYSALALGRMRWNRGDWSGLKELMPLMGEGDRKLIIESLDQMPEPGSNDPYRH